DPVDAGEGGDVERAPVGVAPGEVVRRLRQLDGVEVAPVGRDDPHAAGSAGVDVAGRVDLQAVDGVLPGRAGHVEQDIRGSLREVVALDDLRVRVPVADVQVALVGREGDAVRPGQRVVDDLERA